MPNKRKKGKVFLALWADKSLADRVLRRAKAEGISKTDLMKRMLEVIDDPGKGLHGGVDRQGIEGASKEPGKN